MSEQELTPAMQDLLDRMARMQTELESLKERTSALPQSSPLSLPAPLEISTTRRKTLQRLGLALLGGAAAATAVGVPAAQARLIANPGTNSLSGHVGSLILPPGSAGLTGTFTYTKTYGLAATGDTTTFDVNKLPQTNNTGISGFGGIGVYGDGTNFGMLGHSSLGKGVYGTTDVADNGSNYAAGIFGETTIGNGISVYGLAEGSGGVGVYGSATNTTGIGVKGTSDSSYGLYGTSNSGYGIYGSGNLYGIYCTGQTGLLGISITAAGTGIFGQAQGSGATKGVHGQANGPGANYGVYGEASSANGIGVYGINSNTNGVGISGSGGNTGVIGTAPIGVYGHSSATNGTGVFARADGTNGTGLYATGTGLAGHFDGNLYVAGDIVSTGDVSGNTKHFRIDHPLDPANKFLYHTSIESPDMKNIYDGIATLDEEGQATIQLPDWFEALNKDFRYQLTSIGVSMPGLYIAEEIEKLQFKIGGGLAGQKVSWQVSGNRQDEYAKAHPVKVEVEKSEAEKEFYTHPELYSQLKELSLNSLISRGK